MTEHFTTKAVNEIANAVDHQNVTDDEWLNLFAEACVTAKLKEWEAQGAVAWIDTFGNVISDRAVTEESKLGLEPLFTHPLPAQPAEKLTATRSDGSSFSVNLDCLPPGATITNAELHTRQGAEKVTIAQAQPIKLYADSGNPDMFSRDLLDAAGNRYTIMTPSMCQFDIDASALRAAGLEMKIDGLYPAPDGSSRAKIYWRKVDGVPAEPLNAELVGACGRYEAALMAAFPNGAHGEAFTQWNEARQLLAKRAQAAPAVGVPDAAFKLGRNAGLEEAKQAAEECDLVEAKGNTYYAQLGDAAATQRGIVASIESLKDNTP